MQLMDGETWTEWVEDNADSDEATKLSALRESIAATARTWVRSGQISRDWANKKLAKLGVTDQIPGENTYVLEAPVSGTLAITVHAETRAEAEEKFRNQLTSNSRAHSVPDATVTGDVSFRSGPEDPGTAAADDAPTTVDATLMMLREVIMLGNISGPRWDCDTGTNSVLASYGLAPLPPRRAFTVAVPVEAVMKTTVHAYDEGTAARIAGWRWDDGKRGYDVDLAVSTDVPSVAEIH
jgi:hypothetical protein